MAFEFKKEHVHHDTDRGKNPFSDGQETSKYGGTDAVSFDSSARAETKTGNPFEKSPDESAAGFQFSGGAKKQKYNEGSSDSFTLDREDGLRDRLERYNLMRRRKFQNQRIDLNNIPWKVIICCVLIFAIILLVIIYCDEIIAVVQNLVSLIITFAVLIILLKLLFRRRY